MSDIKRKTDRKIFLAVGWSSVEGVLNVGFGVAQFLVIAAFYSPADLGVSAVVLSVAALTEILFSFGIPEGIVRKKYIDPQLTDAAFYAMLGLGILAYIVCVAASLILSPIYGELRLPFYAAVAGLSVLLNLVSGVPAALLTRKLRARALTQRSILSKLISFGVLTLMGAAALGTWGILLSNLAASATGAFVLIKNMPRAPRFRISIAEIRKLIAFGWWYSTETLIWVLSSKLFAVLFGLFHGVTALGYLQFALRLVDELANLLQGFISRFGLAMFSQLDRQSRDIDSALTAGSRLVTLVSSPLFIGLAVLGPDAISVFLASKWSEAAPIVQILSVAWLIAFPRVLIGPYLRASNRQSLPLIYAAASCCITLTACFFSENLPFVVAASMLTVRQIIAVPWGIYIFRHVVGLPIAEVLSILIHPYFPALVMGALVLYIRLEVVTVLSPLSVLVSFILGAVVYGIAVSLLQFRFLSSMARRL